jgi:nickel-type superoxide dismutase maturation protease
MDPDGATLPTRTGSRSGAVAGPRARWVVAGLALAGAVALLASRVRRVEVAGNSMAPALLAGDRLLVVAPLGRPRPVPGDVVAVPDPRAPGRTLVKRVAAVDVVAGTVDVRGDAAADSTDSRTYGPVPLASVVGRAVWRYGPPDRSGPLRRPTGYDRG